MKVKYFAYIRDYTKTKAEDVEAYEDVEKLLKVLCSKYGNKFAAKVFEGEELSKEIIILVNGRHVVHLDGINTKLKEEDEISIFPVVAGG